MSPSNWFSIAILCPHILVLSQLDCRHRVHLDTDPNEMQYNVELPQPSWSQNYIVFDVNSNGGPHIFLSWGSATGESQPYLGIVFDYFGNDHKTEVRDYTGSGSDYSIIAGGLFEGHADLTSSTNATYWIDWDVSINGNIRLGRTATVGSNIMGSYPYSTIYTDRRPFRYISVFSYENAVNFYFHKSCTSMPTTATPTIETLQPTFNPASLPTTNPTLTPTDIPSYDPTVEPSTEPTPDLTIDPTVEPTTDPTADPTIDPTTDPTTDPTNDPTNVPTIDPTIVPTNKPTFTLSPTNNPTVSPVSSAGVVQYTTDSGSNNNNESQNENALSFFEKNIFLMISGAGLVILMCCLLFLVIRYYKNKKKKNKYNQNEEHTSTAMQSETCTCTMELARVGSISSEGIDIETNIIDIGVTTSANGTAIYAEAGVDSDEPFSDGIALKMWLANIGLSEYYAIFVKNGFSESTDVLSDLNNEDLKDMGISKVAHRKKILKQIKNNKQQIQILTDNNTINSGIVEGKIIINGTDIGTNIGTDFTDDGGLGHSSDDEVDQLFEQGPEKMTLTKKTQDNEDSLSNNNELYGKGNNETSK